jgi:NDP-sugar pyrophosphorylase family protein
MFSLVNILKQILIFRGVEIKSANKYDPSKEIKDRSTPYQEQQVKFEDLGIDISCILAPDNHWSDITYPWELLELNNKMLIQIVEGADWSEDKLNNIGKETILFPKDLEVVIKDAPKITGPCIIKGPCILGRNLKIGNNVYIEGSFIGDNTEIGNFATIRNSNLVKGVHITENVVIENSIIMENSTIYCNCVIVSSILGKYVSTGIGTKFPCRRLKKIEYIPKDRKVTYFSDIKIENPNEFGSIIGDYCQIGSGTLIHPGRRIGKRSIISANSQVLKNLRPNSVIK